MLTISLLWAGLAAKSAAQQIDVPRVEQMPNVPVPYEMRDWEQVVVGYDSLVFDLDAEGQYLPLSYIIEKPVNYPGHDGFGLHTSVGTNNPGKNEAINVLPALVSATLVGLDKSGQNGRNGVLGAEEFFNRRPEENVYLNNAISESGGDWWYDLMPNLFFYQLYDLYPNTGDFAYQFTTVADQWLAAVRAMGGSAAPWQAPAMNYRGWRLATMTPNASGVRQPGAAGAIAWLLYHAYLETDDEEYRMGAEWAMEYLNGLTSNPAYELQLRYGALAAARMNAELGTTYDVEKLVNWVFGVGANRRWGTISGTWGGYDVDGLVGRATSDGYAFAMNTFEQVGTLVPLVRYDDRFARTVGKYVLNAANAARLFYSGYLPDANQDSDNWARANDPNSYIAYEGLRQYRFRTSPYATGDFIDNGAARTNLSLYGSSHVGILGGIIDTTDVRHVLQLDVLKTEYFNDAAYPTYLYYNPHDAAETVTVDVGDTSRDLYDAVSNGYLSRGVSGTTTITLPPDGAVLLVFSPAGGSERYEQGKLLVNGVVVDYRTGRDVANARPRIKGVGVRPEPAIAGAEAQFYCTATDPDGGTLQYAWSAEVGQIEQDSSVAPWSAPDEPGTYAVTCQVTDERGAQAEMTTAVRVMRSAPHITSVTANPEKVDLEASSVLACAATDSSGSSLVYDWTAQHGMLETDGAEATWKAPAQAGDYFVRCGAKNEVGTRAVDSVRVAVRDFAAAGGEGELVAYYPFDGDASDASGHGHDGTVAGAHLVMGRDSDAGSAYRFDGDDDVIRVPNADELNAQDAITVSFWMKATSFFDREAFLVSHGSWQNRWKVSIIDQRLRWTINTGGAAYDVDAGTPLQEGEFYHVAVRYDGNDMGLYVNGALADFAQVPGMIALTTKDLTIGQMLPGNSQYGFAGVLDDVRLYDYALPVNDIHALYETGTDTDERTGGRSPEGYEVLPNYPNPFSDQTVIAYRLYEPARVTVRIYNVLGQKVRTLTDAKRQKPGRHEVRWAGRDERGVDVAAGVYVYEVAVQEKRTRRTLVLIK